MTLTNPQNGSSISQIIPGRLYFASFNKSPKNNDTRKVFINIDEHIHYDPFYDDFGPLNLSVLYRFCKLLDSLLTVNKNAKIFLYTNLCPKSRVNAVYLIASYMVIYQNLSAEQAYLRIQTAEPPSFIGFRDAAMGQPTYLLHVQDVIKSIEKAMSFKWLDFDNFDPDEYEYYERVENGDLNWIVPAKILSFCGPHDKAYTENGYPYHSPESYFGYFRAHNVTTIIRLNKKIYDAKRFIDAGFYHHDLFFIDGSTPSDEIVLQFIEIVENSPGAVAIHCKAGLGRTGTLIACWMMKHYRMTASQCMAWIRICRPGSVIGPQQRFLIEKQQWCWKLGDRRSQKLQNQEKSSTKEKKTPIKSIIGETKMDAKKDILTPEFDGLPLSNNQSLSKPDSNNVTPPDNKSRRRPPSNYLFEDNPIEIKHKETDEQQGELVDETALDEQGRSQGDRLLIKKAKMQNKSLRITEAASTKQKDDVPRPCNFSSATTPIKQLKLSMVTRSASNLARYPPVSVFSACTSRNLENGDPISKVTVSSSDRQRRNVFLSKNEFVVPPSAATEFGRTLNRSFAQLAKTRSVSNMAACKDGKYELRPRDSLCQPSRYEPQCQQTHQGGFARKTSHSHFQHTFAQRFLH